jgi:hypothetical protein
MLYFSKAFDEVPHQRLLKKLAHYGIQDTTYKWIKAFFSNRKQDLNLSPFLNKAVTLAYFQSLGTSPSSIVFLTINVRNSDWKYANVTALFKKGDRFKSSNSRPVSLTCLCCKLQEHLLTTNK